MRYFQKSHIFRPPGGDSPEKIEKEDIKRKNLELAQRHAKRDYLLRGFVFCDTHSGKQGRPRVNKGVQTYKDTYYYLCLVGGCAHPSLNGKELETNVKSFVHRLLQLEPDTFFQLISDKRKKQNQQQVLEVELKELEAKYKRNLTADAELERRDLLGQNHPEVYRRVRAQLRTERVWVEERQASVNAQLARLSREKDAVKALGQIQSEFQDRLEYLTEEEWRKLFTTLDLQVHVRDTNYPPEDWLDRHYFMSADNTDLEITFGLRIEPEPVSNIVYDKPMFVQW